MRPYKLYTVRYLLFLHQVGPSDPRLEIGIQEKKKKKKRKRRKKNVEKMSDADKKPKRGGLFGGLDALTQMVNQMEKSISSKGIKKEGMKQKIEKLQKKKDSKSKKELENIEINRFKDVMKVPAFQNDPLKAVKDHLQNTLLIKEREQKEKDMSTVAKK